jgi:hypothetical protein
LIVYVTAVGYIFKIYTASVIRVLGYRSGGPGSIPGTTRFSGKKKKEKKTVVGLERGPREYN